MTAGMVTTDRADGMVTVTVDRPEKRNAPSREVLDALSRTLAELAGDDSAHVLVLTGGGPRQLHVGG